jgi:hypothetical protein
VLEDAGLSGTIDADNLGDYIRFTDDGGDSRLEISAGGGFAGDAETVALFEGVTGLNAQVLLGDDQLVLAASA